LRWHDFCVGSGELNAGIETSQSVSFNDVATDDLFGTGSAVVRSLWSGEAVLGPAQGTSIDVKECVFLEKPVESTFATLSAAILFTCSSPNQGS
jgi:hypothetical protein